MKILATMVCTLLLVLAGNPAAFAGTTMSIVYADYQPYSWSENGRARGLEIDVLDEALGKRMGIALNHTILPWSRAQLSVKSGTADAFVATSNKTRSEFAIHGNVPVAYWELSLFVRAGDHRFANVKALADLAPFKIGSLIGNGWIMENLPGMDVHYVERMDLLPKMLTANHIDVVADNSYVMHYALMMSGEADKVEELPLSLSTSPMYLYIGKNSAFASIRQKFDQTIIQMRNDGTLMQIYNRYKNALSDH